MSNDNFKQLSDSELVNKLINAVTNFGSASSASQGLVVDAWTETFRKRAVSLKDEVLSRLESKQPKTT